MYKEEKQKSFFSTLFRRKSNEDNIDNIQDIEQLELEQLNEELNRNINHKIKKEIELEEYRRNSNVVGLLQKDDQKKSYKEDAELPKGEVQYSELPDFNKVVYYKFNENDEVNMILKVSDKFEILYYDEDSDTIEMKYLYEIIDRLMVFIVQNEKQFKLGNIIVTNSESTINIPLNNEYQYSKAPGEDEYKIEGSLFNPGSVRDKSYNVYQHETALLNMKLYNYNKRLNKGWTLEDRWEMIDFDIDD